MTLNAHKRRILIHQHGVVGVSGSGERDSALRRRDHLILMTCDKGKRSTSANHPVPGLQDIIGMPPHTPPIGRLPDIASQSIRKDLMAETNADHWKLRRMRGAHEGLQRTNPGQIVIYPRRRSSDDRSLQKARIRKPSPVNKANRVEFEISKPAAKKLREHTGIIRKRFPQGGGRATGFDD